MLRIKIAKALSEGGTRRSFVTGGVTLPFPLTSKFDLTHDVRNQAKPMESINFFYSSPRYVSALKDAGVGKSSSESVRHEELCSLYGSIAGSKDMLAAAHNANKNPPTFAAFDRYGRRQVGLAEFHPAYHSLMGAAFTHRIPSLAWVEEDAMVARCIITGMHYQLEQGTSCPLTMTFAGVAPLKRAMAASKEGSELRAELSVWIEKLTSSEYDPSNAHISLKKGATIGMSMTEKQGGSDVRSNTTTATPLGQCSDPLSEPSYYSLRGHKWFTSAPMSDAFLTLAHIPKSAGCEGGLSCFLVPRWLTRDEMNHGLQFQRLKEKMGDKSNASSEVEYHDAVGMLIGGVGKGVKTIIEMVNLTRLDCLNGSAALMQRAALEATHHASGRSAFGARLVDQPLMQNVLCDLAIESEAANAVSMRIAKGFGAVSAVSSAETRNINSSSRNVNNALISEDTILEANFARLGVAISKYLVCKRSPAVVYEALECLGGNGYTEDFPMARIFRQSPLNAIWEGSGNVIVLDVFRAVQKEKGAVESLRRVLAELVQKDKRLADSVNLVDEAFKMPPAQQLVHGRRTVELMGKLLQASALFPSSSVTAGGDEDSSSVAAKEETVEELIYEAFIHTRLLDSGDGLRHDLLGTLPHKYVSKTIIDRITPRK